MGDQIRQFKLLQILSLIALVFILLGFAVKQGKAKDLGAGVSMKVTPAYQGYFKYGEWLPVWVSLENNGTDIYGEVQIRIVRDFEQITYAVPVSLPSGARKRLPVYVLPNNYTHELKVDLVVNSKILLSETESVYPQPNINYLIGVSANQRGALTLVSGIQLPGGRIPVPVDFTLEELPDRSETLRSLNTLIMNDLDTSQLTPGQVNAIIDWVYQGGRLVIGGGAGALQTTSGFPDDLLPLSPNELTELENLDSLREFAASEQIRVPGPFVIATGDIQQGESLVEQDSFPLVQEINLGKGYITFVALDLTTVPFNAWTGTTDFWETLLTPGAAYPSWMPPDMSPRQMGAGPIGNALANIPNLDLPSSKNIIALLSLYIVFVGPINYMVLRWRKKLHWGWFTIPIITLIFTGLSFGLGYAKRGTNLIINKIAIIQGHADGSAQVTSYFGLFSPANEAYELEILGDNLISPMTDHYSPWMNSVPPGGGNNIKNVTFVQGNPGIVQGLNINQWSMQSFMTETTLNDLGSMAGDLYIEDQKLVGTINNKSHFLLKDVVLILNQNFLRLGDIPSNQSVIVNMDLNHSEMHGAAMSWKIIDNQFDPTLNGKPQREQEFKRMVLESVLDQQNYYGPRFSHEEYHSGLELSATPEVTIIGWIDNAPPKVHINGQIHQETATSLYKSQIQVRFPQEGVINIPAGLITGLVSEMPVSSGSCGFEQTSIWLDKGEAVMEFRLPPEFEHITINQLQLLLQSDGGWSSPAAIHLYNWETESWQILENTKPGIINISDPRYFINSDGLVRVQIIIENQDIRGGSCIYVGLGLEGDRQ